MFLLTSGLIRSPFFTLSLVVEAIDSAVDLTAFVILGPNSRLGFRTQFPHGRLRYFKVSYH